MAGSPVLVRCAAIVAMFALTALPASAQGTPQTEYQTLAKQSFWSTGMPQGFALRKFEAQRDQTPGVVGDVFLQLRGPYAGQGFGLIVTESVGDAKQDLAAVLSYNHGKRAADGPSGAYGWTAIEKGSSSACDSPSIRCYESARAIRVNRTIIVAVIGSSQPIGSAETARVNALLAFALRKLGGVGG